MGEGAPRPAGDGGADAEEHESTSERGVASVEQSPPHSGKGGRGGGGRENSERRGEEWHPGTCLCTRVTGGKAPHCLALVAHEPDSSLAPPLNSWVLVGHSWALLELFSLF